MSPISPMLLPAGGRPTASSRGMSARSISVGTDGPGVYMPAVSADFPALGLEAATALWLCDDASGNLNDVIGSLDLVVAGAPLYRQTVSGWASVGFKLAEDAIDRATLTTGVGPSPATTSQLWMGYSIVTAPTGAGTIHLGCSGVTIARLNLNATPRIVAANGTSAVGSFNPTGSVRPFWVLINRASSLMAGGSDQEALTPTWASPTDGHKGLNAGSASAAPATWLRLWMWSGAAAEKSVAQVSSILTTLGWSPGF